jgi:geranylgeranyl pyrophosphate synthase
VRARAQAVTERAIESLRPLPDSDAKRLLEGVAQELAARVA